MAKYILSIDQGTTGSTALLVDNSTYEVIDKVNTEFTQIYPSPGKVEHDLEEIWNSVKTSIIDLITKTSIDTNDIISIGITNQRETTCAYNKDGIPLANAIVWQDRRTHTFCENKKENYNKLQDKTGLPLDPYFSGTKMNWLLNNNETVSKSAKEKNLLLSTIDTFLLYRLSGCTSFFTEPSNASRTLLMDLKTTNWDEDLCNFFEVDKSFLPEIKDSFSNFGTTKGLDFLPDNISINCILGDQQAALFGQGGYQKGSLKCTYGTGAFILLNTGNDPIKSTNKLLTTVAFRYKGKTTYALEGSTYIAGAAVQFIRDNLKFIDSSPKIEDLAKNADENKMKDLIFYPFFTGIGSPYWNSEAKGSIVGLTRGTSINEICRACLEGIAFSVNDSIYALTQDVDQKITNINVDGGASLNNLLMQLQSDISNCKITRPKVIETTAYGVALGAMIGTGDLELDKIKSVWSKDTSFEPSNNNYINNKKELWTELINKFY